MILLHVLNQRRPAGPRRAGAKHAYEPRIGAYKRAPGGFVRISMPIDMLVLAGIGPEDSVAVYLSPDLDLIRVAQHPDARRLLIDDNTAAVSVTSLFSRPRKATPMEAAVRVADPATKGWIDLMVPKGFPLKLPDNVEEVEWPIP